MNLSANRSSKSVSDKSSSHQPLAKTGQQIQFRLYGRLHIAVFNQRSCKRCKVRNQWAVSQAWVCLRCVQKNLSALIFSFPSFTPAGRRHPDYATSTDQLDAELRARRQTGGSPLKTVACSGSRHDAENRGYVGLAFWRADATLLQQRLQAVVQSGASVSAPTLNCIPDQRSLRRCGQALRARARRQRSISSAI